jgi:hypothetical protein
MKTYLQGLLYKVYTQHPGGADLDEFDKSFLLHAVSAYGPGIPFIPREYDGYEANNVMEMVKKHVRGGNKFEYMSLMSVGDLEQTLAFRGLTAQAVPFSTGFIYKNGMFDKATFTEHTTINWGVEHELRATMYSRELDQIKPNQWFELVAGESTLTKEASIMRSLTADKHVPIASIWEYTNLPDSWIPIADVPSLKTRWKGPDNEQGYLAYEYFSNWRDRYVDGPNIVDDIEFDQIMKAVLSPPGETLETTTPPMQLLPPNTSYATYTDRAKDRFIPINDMKLEVFYTRGGEFKTDPKIIDLAPYFAPYGDKMIKPALSEFRTNTIHDLRGERPEIRDIVLQELGLGFTDRRMSIDKIDACINKFFVEKMTGNPIRFPEGIDFVNYLKHLTS